MCRERLTAICRRLEEGDPANIGLIADRRLPTRLAPTHTRRRFRELAGEGDGLTSLGGEGQGADNVFSVARINRRPLLDSLRTLAVELGLIDVEQVPRRLIGVADIDHLTTITALCRTADRQSGGGVFVEEIDKVARLAPTLLRAFAR